MKYFGLFLLLLGLLCISAQENAAPTKLLVLPFVVQTSQIPTDVGETITDIITNQITLEKFAVMERSSLEKVLQQKIASEPLNPNYVETLKQQQIALILVGQISKVGDKYYGGYRVIDIASARIIDNEAVRGVNSVEAFIEAITHSLLAKGYIQDSNYVVVKKDQWAASGQVQDDKNYVRVKKEEWEALKNPKEDQGYIRVKKDQWEMLNKFARQTRTPLPTLVKQYEYYKTYWKQYAQQQKSYAIVIRAISQVIQDLTEAQNIVTGAELENLQKYQRELGQILMQAQDLQSRDRERYNKVFQAVEQNDLSLVKQTTLAYKQDTTHLQIMSDVVNNVNFSVTMTVTMTPTQGFQDPGAGPDPRLTVQICTYQNWFRPEEWDVKRTLVFERDDLVGEVELGTIQETFDPKLNYGLKMRVLERNFVFSKDEDFGWFDVINLDTAFLTNQSQYSTKNCLGYGSLTIKVQPRRIAFTALAKFRE